MLTIKTIRSHVSDLLFIQQLYETAFPADEKLPFEKIYTGSNTALAFYDQDTFIGFVSLLMHKDLLNIVYFAIDPEKRSHGYGSQILQTLMTLYPSYRIYVDIEIEDEQAANAQQRKRRKVFYLKNHFHLVDFTYTFHRVTYEVLINKKTLTPLELQDFWSQYVQKGQGPTIIEKQ